MSPLALKKFGGEVTLVPAGTIDTATETPTSTGAVVDSVNKGTLRATLDVTAASGTTPSLTVTVQTSADKGVNDAWRDVAAFTAATATGVQRKVFTGLDRYVRVKHAISGTTPSFTWGLSGELV